MVTAHTKKKKKVFNALSQKCFCIHYYTHGRLKKKKNSTDNLEHCSMNFYLRFHAKVSRSMPQNI